MNKNSKTSTKSMWVEFLNARTQSDLDRIKQYNDPDMNKAIQALTNISDDPQIQAMVHMREDAMHEEASALATAEAKGEKKGIKKGFAQGEVQGIKKGFAQGETNRENQIVQKLREAGISEDIIAFSIGK